MTTNGVLESSRRLPVLSVSSQAIGVLDSSDPTVLYNLWSAFARCSDFIENGRRLENLSWRSWNRDVLKSARSKHSSSSSTSAELNHHQSASQQDPVANQLLTSAEKSDRPKIRGRSCTDDTVAKLNQLSLNSRDSQRSSSRSGSSSRQSRKAAQLKRNSSSFIRKKRPAQNQHVSGYKDQPAPTESIKSSITSKAVAPCTSIPQRPEQIDPPQNSRTQHEKNPSTQQIQNIFSLFKPEAEEEAYWRKLWLEKRKQKQETQSNSNTSGISRALTKQKKPTPVKSSFSKNLASNTNTSRPSLFARRSTTAVLDFANSSDEGDDSDDDSKSCVKDTPPRRNNTFTSIVRGFSPSHISVSVVNRSPAIMTSEAKKSPSPFPGSNNSDTSQKTAFPATKARPDKVTREHMFFIESSPSDGEMYGGESLSSNEDLPINTPINLLKKKQSSNSEISKLSLSSQKEKSRRLAASPKPTAAPAKSHPVSLFNKSKSTSAISTKIKTEYHEKKNGSMFIEPSSEDEWDSVDESDYSFDENSLAAKMEKSSQKQPLKRSSLLSSLFLNNPEMVQKEQASHLQKLARQEKSGDHSNEAKSNSPESIGLYRQLSNHAEAHHGSLPAEILNNGEQKVSDSSSAIALSPRTTRRNMLASELSESVRRDLLWERQRAAITWVPSQTANANDQAKGGQLRRSHTSIGVPYVKQSATTTGPISESWQEQFEEDDADFNYHARGW